MRDYRCKERLAAETAEEERDAADKAADEERVRPEPEPQHLSSLMPPPASIPQQSLPPAAEEERINEEDSLRAEAEYRKRQQDRQLTAKERQKEAKAAAARNAGERP